MFEDTFDELKKLGITIPPLSTKAEQDKFKKFCESLIRQFECSSAAELLKKAKVNEDLQKSINEGVKKNFNLP